MVGREEVHGRAGRQIADAPGCAVPNNPCRKVVAKLVRVFNVAVVQHLKIQSMGEPSPHPVHRFLGVRFSKIQEAKPLLGFEARALVALTARIA